MNEEIPMATPPLTAEEESAVAKLSDVDFQTIDATVLANCSERWLKVARVVLHTANALESRYPEFSYAFYAQRLCRLVDEGRLDSQGNLLYMRFSEVRLP
jgi:Protein of unknown function